MLEPMTETTAQDLVPESVLDDLDNDRMHEERATQEAREWAARSERSLEAYTAEVSEREERSRHLAFTREYMATRTGRPWAEVRAEIDAGLKAAEIAYAAAQNELEAAREHERDLLGHVRVLQRNLDEEAQP